MTTEFAALVKDIACAILSNKYDFDPNYLAQLSCDYAQAITNQLALRLPAKPVAPPPPGFDAADLIAKSNAILTALNWPQSQARQWLFENFARKSRNHLTDEELVTMLMLLIEELAKTQSQQEVA